MLGINGEDLNGKILESREDGRHRRETVVYTLTEGTESLCKR
jgi:hypothetical protein